MQVASYELCKTDDGKWALITFSVFTGDSTVALFATPIRLCGEQHLELLEQLVEDAMKGKDARA